MKMVQVRVPDEFYRKAKLLDASWLELLNAGVLSVGKKVIEDRQKSLDELKQEVAAEQ